jgi:hypothetical protein
MIVVNPLGLQPPLWDMEHNTQIQSSVDLPRLYRWLPLDITITDKLVRKIHLHPLVFRNGIIETIGAKMKLIVSNTVSKATGVQNLGPADAQ